MFKNLIYKFCQSAEYAYSAESARCFTKKVKLLNIFSISVLTPQEVKVLVILYLFIRYHPIYAPVKKRSKKLESDPGIKFHKGQLLLSALPPKGALFKLNDLYKYNNSFIGKITQNYITESHSYTQCI